MSSTGSQRQRRQQPCQSSTDWRPGFRDYLVNYILAQTSGVPPAELGMSDRIGWIYDNVQHRVCMVEIVRPPQNQEQTGWTSKDGVRSAPHALANCHIFIRLCWGDDWAPGSPLDLDHIYSYTDLITISPQTDGFYWEKQRKVTRPVPGRPVPLETDQPEVINYLGTVEEAQALAQRLVPSPHQGLPRLEPLPKELRGDDQWPDPGGPARPEIYFAEPNLAEDSGWNAAVREETHLQLRRVQAQSRDRVSTFRIRTEVGDVSLPTRGTRGAPAAQRPGTKVHSKSKAARPTHLPCEAGTPGIFGSPPPVNRRPTDSGKGPTRGT